MIPYTIGLLIGVSACATEDPFVVDERPEVMTFDGLYPVETEIFESAWMRISADLSRYTKIRLEKGASQYRYIPDDGSALAAQIKITSDDRAQFEGRFRSAIRREFSQSTQFGLTDQPANNVATLWDTIVDVNVQRTDDETSVVEFILVVELRDSITETVLVRAVHPYRVYLLENDKPGNWATIDRVSTEIAALLRQKLDLLFNVLAQRPTN